MLNYKLKIGLVPERRYLAGPKRTGIFNPDYAVANKDVAVKYIKEHFTDENAEFVDLEWLNGEGLLYLTDDCEKVAERFKAEGVDAVFIINCNFGNEDAAGRIAKLMKKPVLLWGPRDTIIEPDGTRYTDTQCGLFAISKQLQRYRVPFSYIENCGIEEQQFADGLRRFLSVACMVKNFSDLKVVQVGVRLNPFKSVMYNEMELTAKFGMNMNTVNMVDAMQKLNFIYDNRMDELKTLAADVHKNYDCSGIDDELLIRSMAFVLFYKEIYEEFNASVVSTECWTAMRPGFGANPCLAMSILADMGYPVACESDIHGAVTMALLCCAARGQKPPFFGEFTCRHPSDNNAELLWHCGPFALSLKKPGIPAEFDALARPSFRLADGHYTISRFQADENGKYYLFGGEFNTTEGPKTVGTHLWAEFDNLAAVERKLIEGPYIHHMCEIPGSYCDSLREFCKFVPELNFDGINE